MEDQNLTRVSYHQTDLVEKIANWCLKGYSRSQIFELTKELSVDDLSRSDCEELYNRAKQLLHDSVATDIKQTVSVHVALYEQIFSYYHQIGNTDGANKSLRGKERLLGLVGGVKFTMNHRTDIRIVHSKVEYDESKLNPHQRKKAETLIEKVRSNS